MNREVCRAQSLLVQFGVCKYSKRRGEGSVGDLTGGRTSRPLLVSKTRTFGFHICFGVVLTRLSGFFLLLLRPEAHFKPRRATVRRAGEMDVLPMCSIFQELQIVHDTGYFSALPSLEEYWQQVNINLFYLCLYLPMRVKKPTKTDAFFNSYPSTNRV